MTHVAPRIVNNDNVSIVTRINHVIHFSWQAQLFGEVGQ